MSGPICPLAHIGALDAYVPGEGPDSDPACLRLASNENPYGCSDLAVAAYREVSARLNLYPDGAARTLRQALALHHQLEPEHITCGAGSDEIFHLLARAYLDPDSHAVVSRHGFLIHELAARQSGAAVSKADETDLCTDVEAMCASVIPQTRIVFLANPNNPTGSWLSRDAIRRLHAALPSDCLLVLDRAYAEYVDDNADYDDGLDLAREYDNVVVTGTFSKIYGLAGLRVGWACSPLAVADAIGRVRGPFNVTAPALAAAAAALADTGFVAESARRNRIERTRLAQGLAALGLRVFPSQGNFLLVRCASPETARQARAFLSRRAISVRNADAYELPDCLRITVGDSAGVDALLTALKAFFSS